MIMLEEAIPEKRERSNHILSEMLFAAELDPRNVRVMRRILGKRVHIFRGDTLRALDLERDLGRRRFTVILMNPPFEAPQHKEEARGIWELVARTNTPIWIDMYDSARARDAFENHVSIRFDLMVVEKKRNHDGRRTVVVDIDGKRTTESLIGMPFLPNAYNDAWFEMPTREWAKSDVLYNRSIYSSTKKVSLHRESTGTR